MGRLARRRRGPRENARAIQPAPGEALRTAGAPAAGGAGQQALEDGLRRLGLSLAPGAPSRFAQYMAELLRWGAYSNLTGFRTPQAIVRHGFLGSLACLRALRPGDLRIVDIGSGAGFPGLPLALARPDLQVTLIEANRRRHSFLAHMCRTLGAHNVRCLLGRAEALARDPELRARFDAAFARAVGRPDAAAALAAPFLREGGIFVRRPGADPAPPPAISGYGAARSVPVQAEGSGKQPGRELLIYTRAS